jgi:hypothetical protein
MTVKEKTKTYQLLVTKVISSSPDGEPDADSPQGKKLVILEDGTTLDLTGMNGTAEAIEEDMELYIRINPAGDNDCQVVPFAGIQTFPWFWLPGDKIAWSQHTERASM